MDTEALIAVLQPDEIEYREELPEIVNRTHADFAMRRLADCEAEESEILDQLNAAVERLQARADKLIERARRGQNYFRFLLEKWATGNRPALLRGKAKSVSLLHGRVGWRAKGGSLKVMDPKALEPWLRAQPEGSPLVRTKVEPVMAALQKHHENTGEVPPGTEFIEAGETFYADAEAPKTALTKE